MIRFTPAAPGGPAIDWTNELARRAERSRHPALQTFYQAGCVSEAVRTGGRCSAAAAAARSASLCIVC